MALRRLAYERSWILVIVGMWALGGLVYFCAESGVRGLKNGDFLLPLLALPVVLLIIRRGLTGSRSKRQLWVDVPAGKVVLANGAEHALDELGALSIEKKYHPRTVHTQPLYSYELKAASIERSLFSSFFEGETTKRLTALDAAVVQSALRRLLERPQGDGAFRSGPDLATEVLARAGSPQRALAGLRVLGADDHDRGIREQAVKLAALVESRTT